MKISVATIVFVIGLAAAAPAAEPVEAAPVPVLLGLSSSLAGTHAKSKARLVLLTPSAGHAAARTVSLAKGARHYNVSAG
ncbi:hypothetical protein V495_03235 [Pseudogymnoascus sp. VKM F-4514 (FW-929)]|nr:hypothetical protein V495_03235 [Pseudogymnoascus sp. VKM F-4514 (FW-929)]KFY60008.1 hypothetical protein V497_03936 [Pseudogymnoascus sp. VKM F-4516 (FW-969)]